MPRTIFKIKTYGCHNCNWHTDNAAVEGLNCPNCNNHILQRETDPERMMQITIMGEEDIDTEIEKIQERKSMDDSEKDKHRTKRLKDIQDAILKHIKFKDENTN